MEKKNLELHNLLKSVPSQDFLIDLFGCALQKDIAIQGRMFLTQARICFYSNILGFVTVLVIEFSDVTQITRKNTSFYNSIVITSKDGVQNVFKTFLKEDMNFYDTLKVLWANVTSNQPLELQDLYDIIKKRSQKDSSANETGTTNEATEESGVFDLIIGDLKAKSEPELTGDFVAPTAEVLCGCEDHLEKKEQEIVFNVSAKKLYVMIFGKNNAELTPVSEKHHKKRGNTNVIMGAWSTDEKNSDNQWYINLTKQQKQYVYHTSK